ncbi:RAMP superfamily CRISPR-associated protein [Stygiolobus caldivivus]|uniref:RAMP superfamily CRISPR-associated protein n=1 Tax=Stygiolobus caldivivus TaxID=2824673 RepID=UPI001C857729|nr:RAMP superfamily CRISPR-associated protein [Stygiolobus caldivivus]
MQRYRTPYTERNAPGLEGALDIEMEVVSDYLHVGSGVYDVEILRPLDDIDKLVESALQGTVPDVSGYFSPATHEMNKYLGKVVIPGSTIKGLVRTRLELSIRESCYVVSRNSNTVSNTYKKIFRNPKPKYSDRFPERVCPVCDLLGNSGLASRVSFTDLVMAQGKTDFVNVNGQYYESAIKGSKFGGKVVYRSLKPVDLGMLLYGLGFRLKGNKLEGKVMLMGRFKFSDRRFGRVRFSLPAAKVEFVNALNEFMKKFNPFDYNEEW